MKRCLCIALTAVMTLFLGGISVNAEYTSEQSVIIEYSVENETLQETVIEKNFHSVEKVEKIDENSLAVFFSDGTDMEVVTARLQAEQTVLLAEENYKRFLHYTPNDPYYSSYQWGLKDAGFPDAWDYSEYGGDEIIVAVVDSGVYSHSDLSPNLLAGYNAVDRSTDVTDYQCHGTIVAGVIGAVANNSSYVAGGAGPFNVKILPIKVYDDEDNTIYTSDLLRGVEYAAKNGADVINLSLGGPGYSETEEAKYNEIIESGIPIIASIGNDAQNGNPVYYPASYEKVISVGSYGKTKTVSSFSNYNEYVDISAPGEEICMYAAAYDSEAGSFSPGLYLAEGTSFAAPHVSAVAAIMKSIAPDLTGTDVQDILIETAALPSGQTGHSNYYGWGYLDAAAAVEELFDIKGVKTSGGVLMGEFNKYKKDYVVNKTGSTSGITPECYAPVSVFDVTDDGNGVYTLSFEDPYGVVDSYSFTYKQLKEGTALPCIYETDDNIVAEAAIFAGDGNVAFNMIAASYGSGENELEKCEYEVIDTNSEYETYNIILDKSDNTGYKLFLWNDFGTLSPVTCFVEY